MRDVIAIGGSAGAIPALRVILGQLPAELPASILVVVHMNPHWPTRLADVLGRDTPLQVVDAVDGDELLRGRIYVARPDHHLMVDNGRVRLTNGPRENRSRPCIDVLFRSVAVAFRTRAIGVLLSGALDDGTAGLWAIKDRGGIAIVQSPEDAEVASMPMSAAAQVAVDHLRPAADIAAVLADVVLESAPAVPPSNQELARENEVALTGVGREEEVFKMGTISENTCPECHGTLVKIQEGNIVRYRCHTGHGYSAKTLFSETSEAIERSLYSAIRAIEERSFLLRRMANEARNRGDTAQASELAKVAALDEERAASARALVLGGDDPGRRVVA